MNTLELSNVEISAKLQTELERRKSTGDISSTYVHRLLDPVIQRLATLNPLWRFVATEWVWGGSDRLALISFSVLEHGEQIGTIDKERLGNREVICISNARIAKTRERARGYRTEDANKAVLMAKKMFFKLKPNERIEKAIENANRVMSHQKRLKEREHSTADSTIKTPAHEFIMGTGFHLFLEYIETCAENERNKVKNAMQERERLTDEMMTIEKAKTAFEAGKTALVIKEGGSYLVKIGDKVDLFDDNTLPEWMRGKLGMLKLVQAEQFVSGTGCRVNDETFVLVGGE